jgi:hypothetical protein
MLFSHSICFVLLYGVTLASVQKNSASVASSPVNALLPSAQAPMQQSSMAQMNSTRPALNTKQNTTASPVDVQKPKQQPQVSAQNATRMPPKPPVSLNSTNQSMLAQNITIPTAQQSRERLHVSAHEHGTHAAHPLATPVIVIAVIAVVMAILLFVLVVLQLRKHCLKRQNSLEDGSQFTASSRGSTLLAPKSMRAIPKQPMQTMRSSRQPSVMAKSGLAHDSRLPSEYLAPDRRASRRSTIMADDSISQVMARLERSGRR